MRSEKSAAAGKKGCFPTGSSPGATIRSQKKWKWISERTQKSNLSPKNRSLLRIKKCSLTGHKKCQAWKQSKKIIFISCFPLEFEGAFSSKNCHCVKKVSSHHQKCVPIFSTSSSEIFCDLKYPRHFSTAELLIGSIGTLPMPQPIWLVTVAAYVLSLRTRAAEEKNILRPSRKLMNCK